jgi:glycosyltransferase involved in cell wall biosynthesis
MGGKAAGFLAYNFESLMRQTFKDFDVVVSDQSKDDVVKKICEKYGNRLDIRYFRNKDYGNQDANINNAIRNATGRLIKILFLDDYLYGDEALEKIAKAFDLERDRWLITGCACTRDDATFERKIVPRYDDATILFKNRIGAPSVVTVRNDDPVLFDEALSACGDVDYYKRSFDRFGQPKVMPEINVIIRLHPLQVTNTTATESAREREFRIILKKYSIPNAGRRLLAYRLRRYERQFKSLVKMALGMKTLA